MLGNARFRDRIHAGRVLAEKRGSLVSQNDALVLGLPRGGVPVAFEIAQTLHAYLDVTRASMSAAARAVRAQQPKRIIVAVPVASHEACEHLRQYAGDLICTETPELLYAVSAWYEDFTQTSDTEVQALR